MKELDRLFHILPNLKENADLKERPITEIPVCPCCKQESNWNKAFQTSFGSIFVCEFCGVGRKSEIDAQKANYADYQDHFRWQEDTSRYIAEAKVRVKAAREILKELHRFKNPPGRLIDFGCAAGFFLKEVRESGWDVSGIDINPYAVEYAQKALGLGSKVICEVIEDFHLRPQEGKYDVVTLLNVIGHLDKPEVAIKKAREALVKDGIVFIQTPNLENRWTKFPLIKNKWPYFHTSYLWYFTPKSITLLLENFDFAVEQISFAPRYVSPTLALQRSCEFILLDAGKKYLGQERMENVWDRTQPVIDKIRRTKVNEVSLPLGGLGNAMNVVARRL